jgi:hypothetical protein
MKRIVLIGTLFVAIAAVAQPSGPPPHDALPVYLNLTADQKVAWENAHKEFMAEMKAAHERLDQKLAAVLTPEQKVKFDGFQAAMKAIRGDRPGPPPPPPMQQR